MPLCSIFLFSECSVFKAIGLLDTLGFFGPFDTLEFRAAGYFDFSGRSIFKLNGLLDIQSAFGLLDV